MDKIYMCIDLKSFYASVECVERGLDPLNTNLVVADPTRTEKTVCLAVSPSLKQYGIGGRARVYEVVEKVKRINYERLKKSGCKRFRGKSYLDSELKNNPKLELGFIVAKPRMAHYIKYSTDIYNIYLKYVSKEDIYVYSIDEVFIDITNYIRFYKMSPDKLVTKMIKDVYDTTGITATAGIGTNMYLCKVAMDIVAKHEEANEFGVRIAYLDVDKYRRELWDHEPLTDFWRFGRGTQNKLAKYGIYTMGDIARTSIDNEDLLFKLFGVNAELIIDHAWGYEPVTMKDVKNYKPSTNSMSSGQVLHEPYKAVDARLIVREMMELLSLDLVEKNYVTSSLVLTVGYDIDNMKNGYTGITTTDHYGRVVPKPAHGTINLDYKTSSSLELTDAILKLYDTIVNPNLLIRRINIAAMKLENKNDFKQNTIVKQYSLFDEEEKNINKKDIKKEEELQKVILEVKNKYGKNAILKANSLSEASTIKDRNEQIGGHHE